MIPWWSPKWCFLCLVFTISSVFVRRALSPEQYVPASRLTSLHFALIPPQGKEYWRFDGDVLDEDYPRNISLGFDGVPDDVDASFAIPAPSHRGKEKAYFFKGNFCKDLLFDI